MTQAYPTPEPMIKAFALFVDGEDTPTTVAVSFDGFLVAMAEPSIEDDGPGLSNVLAALEGHGIAVQRQSMSGEDFMDMIKSATANTD